MSAIRQNYNSESEALLNKQINMELYASYVYQAMSVHFDRYDVALPGYKQFFKKSSDEEREHAEKMMKYQNARGGRVVLHDVKTPAKAEWESGLAALQDGLALEREVNASLLAIHKAAAGHDDAHLTDFLEGEFLNEQVESIKQFGDLITKATRAGEGLGEYLFDKETMSEMS